MRFRDYLAGQPGHPKKVKGDGEKWSFIKPFFKAEFAVVLDDKLILDGLTNIGKC
jgi:hypothetical protein